MILTSTKPFSNAEIKQLSEQFEVFIKTVFDFQRKICCAGSERHVDCEQILLKDGSKQQYLWGGGIYLKTQLITYDSAINIRPSDGNRSIELIDGPKRAIFEELTYQFFPEIFND